eukprot:554652-Amphidinium_carterae.1
MELATLTLKAFFADVLEHVTRFSVDQWAAAVATLDGLGSGKPEFDAVPMRAWQYMANRFKNSRTGDRLPPHLKELPTLLEQRRAALLDAGALRLTKKTKQRPPGCRPNH